MSFYTSFFLYRPTKPPTVRPSDVAGFIDAVADLGVLRPGYLLPTQLKFGRTIDRNAKGTTIYRRVLPGMYQVLGIEWDAQEEPKSISDLTTALRRHDRPLYRAFIDLGPADEELAAFINSTAGLEDEPNLYLEGWSIQIEPRSVHTLSSEGSYVVGWISVCLSGNGHMFPLTLPELVRRAETHPKLVALKKLCQSTWPVTSEVVGVPLWWRVPGRRARHAQDMQGGPPSGRVRRLRQEMGELWPHEIDRPFDWEWGIGETG